MEGEDGSPPIPQAMHFSEKLAPDTDYLLVSVALRLMGVAASALETGQFTLASCASFWPGSSGACAFPGRVSDRFRSGHHRRIVLRWRRRRARDRDAFEHERVRDV